MKSKNQNKKGRIYPRRDTKPDKNNPRPGSDHYTYEPFKKSYEERRNSVLNNYVPVYTNELLSQTALAYLGKKGKVSDKIIDLYVTRLDDRYDCADFFAIHIILALYINKTHQFLTSEQFNKLREVLLNFKYWADEPGHNQMIMYTENHQILFHAIEYLAGQMFSQEIFKNNAKTGAWHREHARNLALTWMERRAKWGFTEWSSNVYFEKDVEALSLLAEYSEDQEFTKSAAILLDIVLLEIAFNQFYGFHASTHGRAYEDQILGGWDFNTASLVKLVWGLGTFNEEGMTAALILATAEKYEPSDIIIRIGQHTPETFINYERNGIPLDMLEKYGVSKKDLDEVNYIWSMAAFSLPEVIDLFVKACDKWNLWELPFFDFLDEQQRQFLPRDGTLGQITKKINIDFNRTYLGEVNMITYRTPDYMLSSAQDYRPGGMGYQQHIWQATLSPNAVVFTTNPGDAINWQNSMSPDKLEYKYVKEDGEKEDLNHLPSYWAGQNRLPRVAQYKNISFILYNINTKKAVGESNVYKYTHAFFPQWAFDEILEKDGWIFAKLKDGYIGLYSALPYYWKNPNSEFAHDVVAEGTKNLWICHMGNKNQYDSFENFVDEILNSELIVKVKELELIYSAPQAGKISFSWTRPLTVDGKKIPLSNYKRIDNKYCKSEFNSGKYVVEDGEERLTIDIIKNIREIEKIR
ncbi:MAG: hypothetical protein GF383_00405 [Candidatus Lokiarchaeota archaeon]|nr:hypothetical protein [Candidatus Lokiarchaeota archaeon]MBD3337623.1 hypothetical protein [Candidatus Lokiarchaeota archaeon]